MIPDRELKLCPFCGCHPMFHHRKWKEFGWSIRCICGLQLGDFKTKQVAIDQWNSRPSSEVERENVELSKVVYDELQQSREDIKTLGEDLFIEGRISVLEMLASLLPQRKEQP